MESFEVDALCNVHCHLREGQDITRDLIYLAMQGGADLLAPMPNTKDGLTTAKGVIVYHNELEVSVRRHAAVTFMPIVMVNELTDFDTLKNCVENGIKSCKVYPLNRTTKSHNGVRNYSL